MDASVKRGPSFKGFLVPAILNTTSDGIAVNPERPIKYQTRRLSPPRYSVGDKVAIREPFRLGQWSPDKPDTVEIRYQADKSGKFFEQPGRWVNLSPRALQKIKAWREPGYIKPGLFMYSELSRMTAEIIGIQEEPLKTITAEDAIAEGIDFEWVDGERVWRDYLNQSFTRDHPIPSFKSLWQRIHGLGAWEKNPKVWVTTWKLMEIRLCTRGKLLCSDDWQPQDLSPLQRSC